MRATRVDILREAGFWALEAQDADEAFEILKRRVGVSTVLTDVDKPGSLDGFEFSRLVAQGWLEVGVLVISGKVFPDEGDLPSAAAFIPKPIRRDVLAARIEALMPHARAA